MIKDFGGESAQTRSCGVMKVTTAVLFLSLVIMLPACGSDDSPESVTGSATAGEQAHLDQTLPEISESISLLDGSSKVVDYRGSEMATATNYTRDEHGNIVRMERPNWVGGTPPLTLVTDYEFDESGYVTSFTVTPDGEGGVACNGTCDNSIDDKGRLAQSVLNTSIGVSLTASYSYYGETDNLASVVYSDINNESTVNPAYGIDCIILPQFSTVALGRVFSGGRTLNAQGSQSLDAVKTQTCYYGEDGMLQSIETDGVITELNYGSNEASEEEEGKTVKTQEDGYTTESTFDQKGRLVKRVSTPTNGSDSSSWSRIEEEFTYVEVASPSKAVAISQRIREPSNNY